MPKEYDVIRLTRDLLSEGFPAGTKGTIVMTHNYPGLRRAYEVELTDEHGQTLAVVTLHDEDVEVIWSDPSSPRAP